MIYIASFVTLAELEAERDDPSVKDDSLVDFARPRFSAIFNEFGGFELSKLFDAVKEEMMDQYEDDDTELPLGDRDVVLVGEGVFFTLGKNSTREEATWSVQRGGEELAMIVVQRLPLGM